MESLSKRDCTDKLQYLAGVGNENLAHYKHPQSLLELTASIRRSWKQVKQIEAGEIPAKSACSFINEL